MIKLLTIMSFIIILAASGQPEDLRIDEPEGLSLDGGTSDDGDLSSGSMVELELRTIPQGALIYLDGERLGVSPLVNEEVLSGEHYITVKKRDYLTYDKDVYFEPGKAAHLILPLLKAPEGYFEKLREVQSDKGIVLDLEMGSFRKWLRASDRSAVELVDMAKSCVDLAKALELKRLNHEAMRCRNVACGFYTLLELAGGTDFFTDEPGVSAKLARENQSKGKSNEGALIRLAKKFIKGLPSKEAYDRAYAAHALRHTYCSFDGAVMAQEALVKAYDAEQDEFVLFVITEAMAQIGFESEDTEAWF